MVLTPSNAEGSDDHSGVGQRVREAATGMSESLRDTPYADLSGRRAVVTGAARGIGAAIAEHLLELGVEVVAVDKDKQRLEDRFGHRCRTWITADLYKMGGREVAERVLRESGPAELIVNNVGISTNHGFLDLTKEDYDRVFGTNAGEPFFFTQRLVEELIPAPAADRRPPSGNGAVLFISSVHDSTPATRPHYSASKAAVTMFTRELARDLAKHGIRVNAISPGWIQTNEHPDSHEQREKARLLAPRIPLGRAGLPEEVAKAAIFLLSETTASYITGTTIRIDGGLSSDTWVQDDQL
jgi:NAD(P)-dependent dehydrogenase (short-subunit alcohol dehydrogenase family)